MTAAVLQIETCSQPYLFEMGETDPYKVAAEKEYKRAIDGILKVRRDLQALGQERGIAQRFSRGPAGHDVGSEALSAVTQSDRARDDGGAAARNLAAAHARHTDAEHRRTGVSPRSAVHRC